MEKNTETQGVSTPLPHREGQGGGLLNRFLRQTHFESVEDYNKNLEFIIPENFNFAYDVMDEWAKERPDGLALLWTNDQGEEIRATFRELKEQTDQAASYLQTLGIGKNDPVMLILKRRYEWWVVMLALHKIGAIVIPATHMLTKKDIIYRNTRASVKAIICVDDPYVVSQIQAAKDDSPTVKQYITITDHGKPIPEGFHDWQSEWQKAPPFARPAFVNENDDTMLMYFTSGTSGEPKMVAHDYLYAMGHLTTGVFWHNLHPGSLHLTVADTGWGKAVWGKFYGQWFAGATVFVFDHEKFNADTLLRQMEKYRVTSFCAPPTIYRFMIREDLSKYDLSSLEYCTTAGEALNPAVFDKFFEKTGIRMMEGFGQTETTMTLGTFPWMTPKPGSMGMPNAQYDIDLIRADGTSCEDGEKGEIVIRTAGRVFDGQTAGRAFDNQTAGRDYDGQTAGRVFDGQTAGRDYDGQTAGRDYDGQTAGRDYDGQTDRRDFDGQTAGRDFDGQTAGRAFDNQTAGRAFDNQTAGRAFDNQTDGSMENSSDRLTVSNSSDRLTVSNSSDRLTVSNMSNRLTVSNSSDRLTVSNMSNRLTVSNMSDRLTVSNMSNRLTFQNNSSARQGRPIGLFKGYYRDEELTREAWHDGLYHTGDMAWRDEDGYYWFEGRIDDVIKSSGYRIGPFEVESALMTHPAVVECAITGVPDDIRGMVVKATVVLGKEWKSMAGDELVKELQQHVKKVTAPYKYPRIVEFVDELPKTISGKIRRVEIRQKDAEK